MIKNEALQALTEAGLIARGYFLGDKKNTNIRGGRSADLSGTPPLQVFHKCYDITEEPKGTFTVMHMLDRMDFEFEVPSLEAAVELVLAKYRKAGLLPIPQSTPIGG